MKTINIRESLLALDKKTSGRYELTSLYEACKLTEEDKEELVKYIASYEHPSEMGKFLESKCEGLTTGVEDDVTEDDMKKIIDDVNCGEDHTLWALLDKAEEEDKKLTEDKEWRTNPTNSKEVCRYVYRKILPFDNLTDDNSRYWDFDRGVYEGDDAVLITNTSKLSKTAKFLFSLMADKVDIDIYLDRVPDNDTWYVVDNAPDADLAQEPVEESAIGAAAMALGTAAATGFGQAIGDKVGGKLLGEDTDDEDMYFTDEVDNEVSFGVSFFADGYDWKWMRRVGDVAHLDFDNWAVWMAFRPEDENNPSGPNVVAFFIVDEDTGFIDWGPCDTVEEAQEFLQSKVDDYNNDESLEEDVIPYDKDMEFNDKYFPRVNVTDTARYETAEVGNKFFAYDKQHKMLIYLFKDDEEVTKLGWDKAPWRELDAAGLSADSWNDPEAREEYLSGYADELDDEASYLAQDFIQNELPLYQQNEAVATLERPMSALGGTLSSVLLAHKDEVDTLFDKRAALEFLDRILPEVKNKGYVTKEVMPAIMRGANPVAYFYNIMLKGDGRGSIGSNGTRSKIKKWARESLTEAVPSQGILDDCLQDYKENAFGFDGVEDYVETQFPMHAPNFKQHIIDYLKKNESLSEAKEIVYDKDGNEIEPPLGRCECGRALIAGEGEEPHCAHCDRQTYDDDYYMLEDADEKPYSKEQIEQDLKSLTNNFTVESDTLKCGFKEEAEYSEEILSQYYASVEVDKVGSWFQVEFKDRLKDANEELEEAIATHIYLFPELTDEDIDMLKAYSLKFLGKNHGADGSEDNWVVAGSENSLTKFAEKWLGYELHPDYLYDVDDFAGDIEQE